MAQFKPISTTSSKLNNKTKAEGQFIVTTDDGKIYLDTSSSNRVLVGNSKDTTYTASDGVNINGTKITNSGVRSISTGTSNGTIRANINGTISDVSVYGLGSAAYTDTYAGSSSAGGAATSANKLNTNAGKSTQPVYFENGIPVAITGSIANSTTGSAAKLTKAQTIELSDAVTGEATFDGANKTTIKTTLQGFDAGKITSGTVDIARLPHGALERLVVVANEAARFALKPSNVQNGDTVKQADTGVMYYVVDNSKLSQAAGYEIYTAGRAAVVPWSGVEDKPTSIKLTGSVTGEATLGKGKIELSTTTNHTHNYAGSSSAGGAATSANKLNTDAGSTTQPVYFSGGVPKAITESIANSTTGSAARLQGAAKSSGSLSEIYNVGTGMFQYYYNVSNVNGNMPHNSNANGLLVFNKQTGNYQSFLGFSSNGKIYYKNLTSQTDANTATWDEISFASHNHDNLYLKLTGGTLTGDLIVKNTNGRDISITLDRNNDNANWKIINTGGVLKFQNDYTTGKGNYFDVFTLKYNRDGASLACQLNVGGALTAEGATTLKNTLSVTGATTLNSTLSVARATTLNSTLSVAGATTLNSTLSVTETTTFVDRTTHNGKITVKSSSGSYINGKTTANASIQISTKQTSDYSPVLGITTSSDHVFNLGGISNTVGFYGYLASRTANGTDWSFVVDTTTGNWTCNKKITASGGFEGTLTGNASTATALTSSAGSSTLPIYFKSGKPVAIDKTGVGISITGSADRLQGLEKTSGSLADIYNINDGGFKYYYSINKTVTGNMPTPPNNANSMLVLSRYSGDYKSFIGFSSDGLIYYKNVTSAASAANGAWSTVAFTSSNVASASKLSSGTVGSNTLPVYFNNGVPTAINTTNVGISINGSAAKIVATNSNATGGSEYNLLWLSGTTAQEPKINDGMRYYSQQGTTSATGQSIAILGNATASGTSGNKSGKVRLYGTNTYYTDLAPGTTSSNITLTLPTDSGTLARTTDNVLSATKLQTAKTFTIGSSSKTFDGRNNVSWSLTEIGAAASSHTHNYLPLSGGTLTGTVTSSAALTVNSTVTANILKVNTTSTFTGAATFNSTIANNSGLISNSVTQNAYKFSCDTGTVNTVESFYLGQWSGNSDGDALYIEILTGDGWNARVDQNLKLDVICKNAYQDTQSTTNAFALTYIETVLGTQSSQLGLTNDLPRFEITCYASAHNTCNIYLLIKGNGHYGGYYKVSYSGGTWTNKGMAKVTSYSGTSNPYRHGSVQGVHCGTSSTPVGWSGMIYIQY